MTTEVVGVTSLIPDGSACGGPHEVSRRAVDSMVIGMPST
ncbi:hypothetical protein [Alloactinosynnema sp. L-07]|nr:hypothetical protein [Alloactinosynnema sp. L-07]